MLKYSKAKGSRREREYKKMLEAQGYEVIRTAGSKSDFDLIAIKENENGIEVKKIQVKSNYSNTKIFLLAKRLKEKYNYEKIKIVGATKKDYGCWYVVEV